MGPYKYGSSLGMVRVVNEGPVKREGRGALFCCLDDFAMLFRAWQPHHLIPSDRQRQGPNKLSLGGMLFILLLFPTLP